MEQAGSGKSVRAVVDRRKCSPAVPEALAVLSDGTAPGGEHSAELLTGFALVEQWKPANKPASPLGRMAIAVAEVGLDYVAANPSVLRTGTSGEKVIKSFALALGAPLTQQLNADKLGPQAHMARQLLIVLANAGLDTLKAQAPELISENHIATLISNVLNPVIETAKKAQADIPLQVSLQRMVSTLAGPAANAAMKTVAANPSAFLGANFASSKAVGALVGAVLSEAAKGSDLRAVFTDNGLLKLLSASLQVAADKPTLFVKTGDRSVEKLLVDLTASLATQMKVHVDGLAQDRNVDRRAIAAGIAAAAISAFGQNAAVLIGGADKPWNELAATVAAV